MKSATLRSTAWIFTTRKRKPVSGGYSMIEAGAAAGAGERDVLVLETLMACRRAGCSCVLTYHAPLAARLLDG